MSMVGASGRLGGLPPSSIGVLASSPGGVVVLLSAVVLPSRAGVPESDDDAGSLQPKAKRGMIKAKMGS
jgi:hypothetical protein